MKKNINIVGILSVVCLLFALIFLILHWPLNRMLYLSGSLFSVVFILYETLIKKEGKTGKIEFKIVGVTLTVFIVSMAFYRMHWAGGFYILMTSLFLLILSFILVLFKIKDSGHNLNKNGIILISVLLLIGLYNVRPELIRSYKPLVKSIMYFENINYRNVPKELEEIDSVKEEFIINTELVSYLKGYGPGDDKVGILGNCRVVKIKFNKKLQMKIDLLKLLKSEKVKGNYYALERLCNDEDCSLGDFLVEYNLLKIELIESQAK